MNAMAESHSNRSVQTGTPRFSCMKAHKLFPGRTSLYVREVSDALRISVPHVISLINEGLLGAIEITGKDNKTSQDHWRIPVGEFDAYVERRRSDKKGARRGSPAPNQATEANK